MATTTGSETVSSTSSSDAVNDFFCEACAEDDNYLHAKGYCVECNDFLCKDCVASHARNRATRKHVVKTDCQMPRQKPTPTMVDSDSCFSDDSDTDTESDSVTDSESDTECHCCDGQMCEEHPDRQAEYFCQDHRSLSCTVCLVRHRRCEVVDHITNVSENLIDSQEYKQFTASLESAKSKALCVIKDVKDNAELVEKLFSDMTVNLQKQRKATMDEFDVFAQLITKLRETSKLAEVEKIKTIGDSSERVLSEAEEISTDLELLHTKKQKLDQLFVCMIRNEENVKKFHDLLDDMVENNKIDTERFQIKRRIIGQLFVTREASTQTDQLSLPQIKEPCQNLNELSEEARATAPVKPPVAVPGDLQAVRVRDINVRTRGDKEICRITGSTLLPDDKMVLSDFDNGKLKLLNLKTNRVTSVLKTPSKPWDVSSITDDQVAVTLHYDKAIAFVKVATNLKIVGQMNVNGKCESILYTNDDKLIVSFSKPPKIEIMNLDGVVERKIESKHLFDVPSHMSLSPGHDSIYMSDNNGVIRFTLDGTLEAEYKDKNLKGPRGVAVDTQGRVLVCGSRSSNIHLLTPDLSKVKVLVDKLIWPCGLSVCHSSNKMYVRHSGYVRVYQLS